MIPTIQHTKVRYQQYITKGDHTPDKKPTIQHPPKADKSKTRGVEKWIPVTEQKSVEKDMSACFGTRRKIKKKNRTNN